MQLFNKELVLQSDRRHTYIIEGVKDDNGFFNITRFICQVSDQGNRIATEKLGNQILDRLRGR